MATEVIYNGITIHNALIRDFHQEVLYDPSNTDHWCSRYTITVEGIVSCRDAGPWIDSGVEQNPQNTHKIWQEIRAGLMEPRRSLAMQQVWWQGGEQQWSYLFGCEPATGYVHGKIDVSNGPKPLSLRAQAVLGRHMVRVQWTVQCDLVEGPTANLKTLKYFEDFQNWQLVLDNRWSIEEDFDEDFYCRRTIAGLLRLSMTWAKILEGPGQVDTFVQLRQLCTPPLEPGFKRTQMRYAIESDGLQVRYQVIDRQVHTSAPWPATQMEVRHRRGTQAGTAFYASCDIDLVGPPHVPRTALLARGIQIADWYVGILQYTRKSNEAVIVRQADIVEHIGAANRVTLSFMLQLLGDPKKPQSSSGTWMRDMVLALGKDLDLHEYKTPSVPHATSPGEYNPVVSWTVGPHGVQPDGYERSPLALLVLGCYLQRPYWNRHGIGQPAKQEQPHAASAWTSGTRVERLESKDLENMLQSDRPPDQMSASHKQHLYTYSRMKNVYRFRLLRIACPMACTLSDNQSPNEEPTVHITQLGKVMVSREIRIDAERIGQEPEIPKPIDYTWQNVKVYLQKYDIHRFPPMLSPMGDQFIYRTQARYRWLLDRQPPNEYPWPIGHLPHVADQDLGFDPQKAYQAHVGPLQKEQSS